LNSIQNQPQEKNEVITSKIINLEQNKINPYPFSNSLETNSINFENEKYVLFKANEIEKKITTIIIMF